MLVVEPARNHDVDPVARLALDALRERYSPEWLASHAEGVRSSTFLVARDVAQNQVVGFAIAQQREAESHLLALAVNSRRRGQGIGAALLRDVRDRAARSGAMRMVLDVRWDDPKSRMYYEHHGFHPVGIQEKVYSDGGDALEMERPV